MIKKEIVVVGGGTGTYTVLSGLRKYPAKLSVIVSMMDDGGSNRKIRDEFGLLPTSDIRQCIVALTPNETHDILRKLFVYRYTAGVGIAGMTFGNLFMAALTDIYGDQNEAIKKTCEFLNVVGNIIPVTYDDVRLVATYSNGKQVLGQYLIVEPVEDDIGDYRIVELVTIPKAKANKAAIQSIKSADLIVLGPGDLYTSIICNLVVDGISKAIKETDAKIVYVVNLMTKYGETHKFSATDHIIEIEKFIGKGRVDVCIVNKTNKFPKGILERYKIERAYPVKDDLNGSRLEVIREDFIANKIFKKAKSDKLRRSLIRHDQEKLAKAIFSLL